MNRTIYETQASNWSRLAGAIIGETPRTTILLEASLIIINVFFILLIDVRHDVAKEECQEIVSIIIWAILLWCYSWVTNNPQFFFIISLSCGVTWLSREVFILLVDQSCLVQAC